MLKMNYVEDMFMFKSVENKNVLKTSRKHMLKSVENRNVLKTC